VRELKVLVGKARAINGLAAAAVARRKVAALQHKARDHAVELGALVRQGLAHLAHTLFARAQRAEVLRGLGHHLAEQAKHHTARGLAANLNVEKHLAQGGAEGGGGCGAALKIRKPAAPRTLFVTTGAAITDPSSTASESK
jgi:hypothetical protein